MARVGLKMGKDTSETARIAIAVFIVATMLTVVAADFSIPTALLIPAGAFLLGLIVTAVLAFMYILAKGYELRYKVKKRNVIDKYHYILYNLAVTAYVIVAGVILLGFSYSYLDKASKEGNAIASAGIVALFILVIFIVNRKDIKELASYLLKRVKQSKDR